jgi:hypothetical protein
MLQKLTNILKSEDISIQQSLQIISYFKRMNILDENELRIFFLQHRLFYYQNQLSEVRFISAYQYVTFY